MTASPTQARRKRQSRGDGRAAVYARLPRCPADCATCLGRGFDAFVPLAKKSQTRSVGNERGARFGRDALKYKQQEAVFGALANKGHRPNLPVVVRLTRVTVRASQIDKHAEWHKHIVDEVARWLGVDDGSDDVTWMFTHAKGATRGVRIQVKTRTLAIASAIRQAEMIVREAVGFQ